MPKQQKQTYNEAVIELDKILFELENTSEVNMDLITQKVKRASELMTFCRKQLHEIDSELEKLLDQLD